MSTLRAVPRTMVPLAEMCGRLGISAKTAREWAAENYGPPAYYIGRAIKYRPEEIEHWINGQRVSEVDAA